MFSPLTWIIILIIAGFFLKKKPLKRTCFFLALIIFLVFSSPAFYNQYAKWYQPKPAAIAENEHYSFGIVAGGFGSVDANGKGYFNSASDRFLQTVKLYKTGMIDHILISGGNSKNNDEGFGEGKWAKKEMIEFGVPDSVIFVEDRSDNTKDNAINSKKILDSLGTHPPYVLITSAFHMPRAKRLYEQAGMEIIPFPCNYTEGRGPVNASDFIPRFALLSEWSKYIRESVWMAVKG